MLHEKNNFAKNNYFRQKMIPSITFPILSCFFCYFNIYFVKETLRDKKLSLKKVYLITRES